VLRDHGADLHLRDRNGNTALHLACKSGRVPVVEILLAMEANVNARNYSGLSAIAEARKASIFA
jgi:ankyrin repeat protein